MTETPFAFHRFSCIWRLKHANAIFIFTAFWRNTWRITPCYSHRLVMQLTHHATPTFTDTVREKNNDVTPCFTEAISCRKRAAHASTSRCSSQAKSTALPVVNMKGCTVINRAEPMYTLQRLARCGKSGDWKQGENDLACDWRTVCYCTNNLAVHS